MAEANGLGSEPASLVIVSKPAFLVRLTRSHSLRR